MWFYTISFKTWHMMFRYPEHDDDDTYHQWCPAYKTTNVESGLNSEQEQVS